MKSFISVILIAVVAVLGTQCASTFATVEGTVIRGAVKNASNLQVYLDKVVMNKPNQVLEKKDADANGKFEFNYPQGLEAGIYRLRIGAQMLILVLDGKEGLVEVEGELNTLSQFGATIKGSASALSYATIMKAQSNGAVQPGGLQQYMDTCANPFAAMLVAAQTMGQNPQFLPTHKKVHARLVQEHPSSENTRNYGAFISQLEAYHAQQQAAELVQIGQTAPDISLPSPKGKTYNLSDLKGKVVLLDFWASWCGPCRRENPNVVRVYEKYKDQGFTVFSVSLDGLGQRELARFSSQADIDKEMKSQKQRWVDAIQKDGLPWPYHVSDLKKWDCAPARLYGVNSIPRTFLIDREGKIAATNLRGAEQIEAELLKVL